MNVSSLGYKKPGSVRASYFTNVITKDITFDPPSLAAAASATSSGITVTGAKLGDRVNIFPPTTYSTQGIRFEGYVDAADTIKIVTTNPTASTVDLASGTYTVQVVRK